MEWKKIIPSEPVATCNHVEIGGMTAGYLGLDKPTACSAPAAWRAEASCGCGAIHSELLRCDEHRISDLEEEVARTKKTVEGLVRYARTLNPDIRTDEECVLFAAGYHQTPRDDGDELWKTLNTTDVAGSN